MKWETTCVIYTTRITILYIQYYLTVIAPKFKRNKTGRKFTNILMMPFSR